MIFVTVGGQLPFDRLVHAVDRFSASSGTEVFAQIGASERPPEHVAWKRFLSPPEFRDHVARAQLIVSHAGIGTILTAIDLEKPIVVMPRRSALGEHRNDHQAATVKHLGTGLGVHVAEDESDLVDRLERASELTPPSGDPGPDHRRLLDFVRSFVGD